MVRTIPINLGLACMFARLYTRQRTASRTSISVFEVCACDYLVRHFTSDRGSRASHYEVLGVPNLASTFPDILVRMYTLSASHGEVTMVQLGVQV